MFELARRDPQGCAVRRQGDAFRLLAHRHRKRRAAGDEIDAGDGARAQVGGPSGARIGAHGEHVAALFAGAVFKQFACLGQRLADPEHRLPPFGGRIKIAAVVPHDPVRAGICAKIDAGDPFEAIRAEHVHRGPAIAGERHVLPVGRGREFVGVGATRQAQHLLAAGQIDLGEGVAALVRHEQRRRHRLRSGRIRCCDRRTGCQRGGAGT